MNSETIYRVVFTVTLLATFAISGYFRRRARMEGGTIERQAEGGWIYMVRMVISLPLFVTLLLYIFYPRALEWASFPLPPWVRSVYSIVALMAVPMFFWVFRSIGKNVSETILTKDGHELVRNGPYRIVRHPLYSSALLLIGSLGVVAANGVLLLYFAVGWPVFRYIVVPAEEKHLVQVFGDEYRSYQDETGAMLPNVFKTREAGGGN